MDSDGNSMQQSMVFADFVVCVDIKCEAYLMGF